MRITQPSGRSSFSHSSWEASQAVQQHERSRQAGHPQRRASEEAGCSKEFQQARPATEEEEAWLDTQEQLLHKQAEWLVQQAGSPSLYQGLEPELFDAEAFNRDDQLACWMQAQEEALAVQEAESFCLLEEEIELELLELAGEKDIKSHLMMKALREGAMFLVDEESAEKADYQSLVSIQQSAQKLLELVDRAMHAKVEEERRRVFNQVTSALLHKREIEDMAAVEKGQLQSEINRLKQEHRDLHDLLEREKDRTTCRICFIRPRDVLPLPCMHFDYCNCCLQQYQRSRNLCPTCRSPISGVLKYNLSIG